MSSVLFLVHSAAESGAELALLRVAKHWPENTPLSVVFGSDGPLVSAFERAHVDVSVHPMPKWVARTRREASVLSKALGVASLCVHSRQLRRHILREKPDVVVAASLKAVLYGRLATWRTGTRFVWSCHDRITRDYLGRVAPVYSRLIPRLADGVIVNSRSTLGTLVLRDRPVLVNPPSVERVDVERTRHGPIKALAILGRLAPWKGQDVGIRAFARLGRPDLQLHVIGGPLFGEDEYAERLHQLTSSLGVAENVTFHGHTPDPFPLLDDTDLLMHTSVLPEPFGAVVIEGMDRGCLVVATRPGGPAEVVDDGVNGFLADAGDVDSLVAALERALSLSESERASMRDEGRTTTVRFDAPRRATELATWLTELATDQVRANIVSWEGQG